MARRELGPAALRVARAVSALLPEGDVTVGCSGGADSLALAFGAQWAADRAGTRVEVLVVDHGLQDGSREVADGVVALLRGRGLIARSVSVTVAPAGDGMEAAAREARLAALAGPGLPVLLGHTMDDQAESVLLGLLRGSGTRSLAGMAARRGEFLRPLLGLRRADTEAACRDWGLTWWEDPMNADRAFARVRARLALAELGAMLGRDLAPALARTARLARADADLLDELAAESTAISAELEVGEVGALPEALRWRVLHRWLGSRGIVVDQAAVLATDRLVTRWRGQGPVTLQGGSVRRSDGRLIVAALRDGDAAPGSSR